MFIEKYIFIFSIVMANIFSLSLMLNSIMWLGSSGNPQSRAMAIRNFYVQMFFGTLMNITANYLWLYKLNSFIFWIYIGILYSPIPIVILIYTYSEICSIYKRYRNKKNKIFYSKGIVDIFNIRNYKNKYFSKYLFNNKVWEEEDLKEDNLFEDVFEKNYFYMDKDKTSFFKRFQITELNIYISEIYVVNNGEDLNLITNKYIVPIPQEYFLNPKKLSSLIDKTEKDFISKEEYKLCDNKTSNNRFKAYSNFIEDVEDFVRIKKLLGGNING